MVARESIGIVTSSESFSKTRSTYIGRSMNPSKPRAFVLATIMFVNMMVEDMRDRENQGPNFAAQSFPIAALTAAFLTGDDVIGASPEDIEEAKTLAEDIWCKAWGIDPDQIVRQ